MYRLSINPQILGLDAPQFFTDWMHDKKSAKTPNLCNKQYVSKNTVILLGVYR